MLVQAIVDRGLGACGSNMKPGRTPLREGDLGNGGLCAEQTLMMIWEHCTCL